MQLKNTIQNIKQRLGELWWYTLLLFVAQRVGDVIQAFIGIWLVPKYVPQSELGAVLPLMSVGGLLGFPLVALMIPFMKFLNKYMALGEFGKVKRLLRDTFLFAAIIFVIVLFVSRFLLPLVFERMRIEDGSLSLLIIATGIVSALAPVFSSALQALKKFTILSVTSTFSAIVRLVTLLVCLPIRGLSGYFVGQIIPSLFNIGVSLLALRKQFGRNIKMTPYWNDDWRPILRYAKWAALLNFVGMAQITTELFVIRRCLPDVESAGFYMISRFAEITFYFGASCSAILFPLVSERHERGQQGTLRLLSQSIWITLIAGFCLTFVVAPFAHLLFTLKADWNVYLPFIPHLIALSIIYAFRGALACFSMFHIARNQFRFISVFVVFYCFEIVLLYCLTGYTFFAPWMPEAWLALLTAFNPCRLPVVLGIILLYTLATLIYVLFSMGKAVRNASKGA